MATKRTTTTTTTEAATAKPPEVEAMLNTLGLQIAKIQVGSWLEQYTSQWLSNILLSEAPEHVAIRQELISTVSKMLAAKTLQQCLSGAISDVISLPATSSAEKQE